MKKIFTFFVFALCAVCAWAQGTMTGADLAAMMGSTVYEANIFGAAQKVYAKADGNIYQQWGTQDESVIVEASAQVTFMNSTYSSPGDFMFYLENGTVSKVNYFGSDLIPALGEFTEADLAAQIGDDVYIGFCDETFIAHDGAIYIVDGQGTETALHDMFSTFERIGDACQFSNQGAYYETNVVFNQLGDKYMIYYTKNYADEKYVEYICVVPVDDVDLVALMGDAVYVNEISGERLFVKDGKVFNEVRSADVIIVTPLSENHLLTKNDDTFIFVDDMNGKYEFYVQDGKVSEVKHREERYVYKESGNATSVDAINAEKSGMVIKTIENGKVVIIRNGEKYDLAGRKL